MRSARTSILYMIYACIYICTNRVHSACEFYGGGDDQDDDYFTWHGLLQRGVSVSKFSRVKDFPCLQKGTPDSYGRERAEVQVFRFRDFSFSFSMEVALKVCSASFLFVCTTQGETLLRYNSSSEERE